MITAGLHTPEQIIQAKCHPGKRLVMARMEGGKHPAKLGPSQTSIVGIFEQDLFVIQNEEFVLQGRKKDDESYRGNHHRRQQANMAGDFFRTFCSGSIAGAWLADFIFHEPDILDFLCPIYESGVNIIPAGSWDRG